MPVTPITAADNYDASAANNADPPFGISNDTAGERIDDVIRPLMAATKGVQDQANANFTAIQTDVAAATAARNTNTEAVASLTAAQQAIQGRLTAIEADGWVTSNRIGPNAVGSGNIENGSISPEDLQANAALRNLRDGSVPLAKLQSDPRALEMVFSQRTIYGGGSLLHTFQHNQNRVPDLVEFYIFPTSTTVATRDGWPIGSGLLVGPQQVGIRPTLNTVEFMPPADGIEIIRRDNGRRVTFTNGWNVSLTCTWFDKRSV